MLDIIAIVCSIIMLVQAGKDKKLSRESTSWPKTKAKILTFKRMFLNGFPQFTYEYEVNGEKRIGKRLVYCQAVSMAYMKELKEKYAATKVGDEIEIHYSPTNSTQAVMIPGPVPGENKAYWIGGIILFFVAVVEILFVVTHAY